MDKWVVPATIFGMLFAVAVAWIFDSAWAFLAAMIREGSKKNATARREIHSLEQAE